MPIFNPPSDSISESLLEAIQSIELSGGGGNARYRYAASGKATIPADELTRILPATPEPVSREVRIKVLSGGPVALTWQNNLDPSAEEIRQGFEFFYDSQDGGMELNVFATTETTILVFVRQDKPINYQLNQGIVFMPNVNVELWIDTTFDYAQKVFDFDIYSQIQAITQSEQGIAGYKLFYLTGFAINEPLSINVVNQGVNVAPNIQIQWINQQKMIWLMSMLGLNQYLTDIPSTVIAEFSQNFIWAGETANAAGGEITIRPTLSKCMGRIVAKNSLTGANDSCTITGWTPDPADPKKGGTLTIGGF